MKSLHKSLLTAGLLATLGLGAIAQTATAPAPVTPQRAEVQAQRGQDAQQRKERFEQRRLQKLERFKQKLAITAAQEGAWNQWVNALKPEPRLQRPSRNELIRMDTPQRIDRLRALRAEHMARMDRRDEATKAFYAALNADQKKVFDESGFGLPGGKRGFRGHGHPGHKAHGHGHGHGPHAKPAPQPAQ